MSRHGATRIDILRRHVLGTVPLFQASRHPVQLRHHGRLEKTRPDPARQTYPPKGVNFSFVLTPTPSQSTPG